MAPIAAEAPKVERRADYLLCMAVFLLVGIGLMMVFETSSVKSLDSSKLDYNPFYFVKRQGVGAILGLVAMFSFWKLGYWRLRSLAILGMICGGILLCLVWAPKVGVSENGAARWVRFGSDALKFQPSELAKLLLILYLARIFSRPDHNIRSFVEGLAPSLCVIFLYVLLVERQPDLGTAIVLFLTALTMMYMAGAQSKHLAGLLACAMVLALAVSLAHRHRLDRLLAFYDPQRDPQGIGYQVRHSRNAIGSGMIVGAGLGQGREKFYLPQKESDFIFATLAEETGFVGSMAVLLLLTTVAMRGIRIAKRTDDSFGRLTALGIVAMISWQALINIGVATVSIPTTGVPLPFISYGSSSLVALMAAIGILMSVAQNPIPPGSLAPAVAPRRRR